MKRSVIAALAASFTLLVLASSAGAVITVTQAPAGPGYQNLSPWNCGGHTYYLTPRYDASGAWIPNTGNPIRLQFGWFANNEGGLRQFWDNTHGFVSITGSDTFGDSWLDSTNSRPFVTGQNITWSDEAGVGGPPGGATVTGKASIYRGVLALAPGTYTLSVTFAIDKAINDGWDTYTSDLSNTPCTFTVDP